MKNIKRILSASLIFAVLFSMMALTVNAATIYTLSLSADKTELVKGDEVVLDINISPDVKNMTSLQYTVKFDPDVFFIDGTSEDEYSPMRCFDSTWYDSFNDMYFSSNIYNAEPANGLIIYSATKLSPGASRNLDVGLPLGRFHLALKDEAVKSNDYSSVITVINAATSKHAETGGEQPATVQNLTFTIKGGGPDPTPTPTPTPVAEPSIAIESRDNVDAGNEFTVAASFAGIDNLAGGNFKVAFNSSLVSFVKAEASNAGSLQNLSASVDPDGQLNVNFALKGTAPINALEDTKVIELTFKANDDIAADVDATLEILSAWYNEGGVSPIQIASANFTNGTIGLLAPATPALPLGDVTKDGKSNISDITWILEHIANPSERAFDADQLKAGDFNKDGTINAADITAFLIWDLTSVGEYDYN